MKKILSNIPTNIITGFLGAGKTTAIRHLLKHKPASEKWAVLVNEFGEVGIDGALLKADGIAVTEVPGGCMCCAVGLPSKVALNKLIRSHQPDRILIEPTGLAHPQQVVQQFSTHEYKTLLDMQAVVCLVDPWSVGDPQFTQLPAFQSQIELADVVVVTKMDTATPQQEQNTDQFIEALAPKKARVAKVTHGEIPWQWLTGKHQSLKAEPASRAPHLLATAAPPKAAQDSVETPITEMTRRENNAEFGHSCGWEFPPGWQFNAAALKDLLNTLQIPRIKGIVHTTEGWRLFNRMRTTVSIEAMPESSSSRLEMIHTENVNWDDIETQLLQSLAT